MKRKQSASMASNRRSVCVGIGMALLVAERQGRSEPSTASTAIPTMSKAAAEAFMAACRAAAPIHGQSDLDAWLAAAGLEAGNPLAPLSIGGRRRLLASLIFREGGLIGIDTADLEAELTLSQAYRVLSLFGFQGSIVHMPDTRIESDEDRAVAAWRTELEQAQ